MVVNVTQPVYCLPPLEYRYALDAAAVLLGETPKVTVCCNVPALADALDGTTIAQTTDRAEAAVWIEPQLANWENQFATLENKLGASARLVIIASQPLARLVPERRHWPGQPLGMRPGGVSQLKRKVQGAGFLVESVHGFHSITSIGLNFLVARLEGRQRPEVADRVHFAARLGYHNTGPLAHLSTVTLIVARRGQF